METRLDTFNGWQMKATVESRPTNGGSLKYYIVQPATYKEFSTEVSLCCVIKKNTDTAFETADAAFYAAFSDWRHAIRGAIKFRGLHKFS